MVAPLTRRALLGAGALLVAGCGDDDAEPPRAAERPGGESSLADVALLNDALAAEERAGAALALAPGALGERLRRRGEAHAEALRREIARLRGRAQPLAGGAAPPGPEPAAQEVIALYVDMLPKLGEPRLRSVVARLLADAATALAELRVEQGEPAAPAPFVAGRPA